MIDPEKITGIYERKLIRKLLQTDQQTNAIYRQFIERTSPILAKYRQNTNGVIIRDPDLNKQLDAEVTRFQKGIDDLIKENQSWAWALANEKNDEIIKSFIGNNTISKVVEKGLFQSNIDAFNAFQKRKYDGLQLSDRIWNLADGNKDILEFYLDNGLATGKSAQSISQDVRQLLQDPDKLFRRVRDPQTGELKLSKNAQQYNPGRGKYRSSVQNARRLARTEVNMAYRSADQDRWNQLDFILGYEVKLSDRHPAPDICDHAKGKYPKEFKFVGWHPNCLCYAVPVLPDEETFLDSLVDDDVKITGQVSDIPESMKTYIADNREKIMNWKKQPFWVQDNFKGGRIEKGISLEGKKSILLKTFQSGGKVSIFPQVDKSTTDYKALRSCADFFAKEGKTVEILPKIHPKDNFYTQIYGDLVGTKYAGKCPDLKVDGKFYEHEGFISKNPKNALRNMLKHGHVQSNRLIIDDCGHDLWYYKKRINDYMRDNKDAISELWLRKGNGLNRLI